MLAELCRHGMAGLMIGGQALCLVAHLAALLLRAHLDLENRFVNIFHGDETMLSANSEKRRFVHQVFEIRTGKSGCALCNGVKIHIIAELLVSGMDLQDRLSASDVRQADIDLAVKTSGTEQRVIQDIRTVGRRHDDHALVVAEAVHFDQQLVQSLLALIMSAAETASSLAADRVDLIDKDDRGCGFLCLFKQVPDTAGADADIKLDKIGTGDGKELHAGFSGNRLCQQGFTGSRRAYQQNPFGNSCAHGRIGLRILQELHNLCQFFLFLIAACDIGKGFLILLIAPKAGSCLAEAGHPSGSAAHAVHHHIPEHHRSSHEDQVRDNACPPRDNKAFVVIVLLQDTFLVLFFDQLIKVLIEYAEAVKIIGLFNGRFVRTVCSKRQNDLVALCPERLHLSRVKQIRKLRVVVQRIRLGVLCHREDDRDENQHKKHIKANIPGTIVFWVQISSHPF